MSKPTAEHPSLEFIMAWYESLAIPLLQELSLQLPLKVHYDLYFFFGNEASAH